MLKKTQRKVQAKKVAREKASRANNIARLEKLGRTLASTLIFASVYGKTKGVVHQYHLDGRRRPMFKYEADAVSDAVVKWHVYCLVILRDEFGKEYWRSMIIDLPEPVKQDAIHRSLSRMHYDYMVKEFNTKHVLTLGWIATAAPIDISKDVIESVMTRLGAWDGLDPITDLGDGAYQLNFTDGSSGLNDGSPGLNDGAAQQVNRV